jgi:hypothetical protein
MAQTPTRRPYNYRFSQPPLPLVSTRVSIGYHSIRARMRPNLERRVGLKAHGVSPLGRPCVCPLPPLGLPICVAHTEHHGGTPVTPSAGGSHPMVSP